jgi:zinc transport system ATP-binding protein
MIDRFLAADGGQAARGDEQAVSDAETPVLTFEDVTFAYGEAPVLEDVTFSVEQGSFLGVVGPNGSGKSTLLKLALGLETPDRGRVELFGEPADAFDDGEKIAYIAQRATDAIRDAPLTVREVVAMGRYPRTPFGTFDPEDHRAVDVALEQVGMDALEDRRVGRLSGGQRQRVFIARALAADAELLVLDEPTVGVDAESRERIYELVADLHASGLTVLLVEHDVGVVTEHATEIACLNRELYFHGDPETFVRTDALATAYGTDGRVLHHSHP